MAPTFGTVSNPALAGRIQGFGNVNPPPLEEETAKSVAKRVVGNLGNIVGEEVLLTVEDFKQKGAVGAVKDAVADAGDILIDGVAGVFGWLRGDPPAEEEEADEEKSEKAAAALAQGPAGAAYGVSQSSPTGGINAVWVMPEEADPATLAQLASQSRSAGPANIQPYAPHGPMQVPGGPMIQPYQPSGAMQVPGGPQIQPYMPQTMQIPGGPAIQPYTPGLPGQRGPAFAPGAPMGFQPGFQPGPSFPSAPAPSAGAQGGARGLVEGVAKGDTLPGPGVAKRLLGQCTNAKLSEKQLGELICERARRLYLGLDSACGDSDEAMLRVLGLVDALAQQDAALAKGAVKAVVEGISEELLSLQSSTKHKAAAEPMLRRVGLLRQVPEAVDLLGGEAPAQTADLLGGSAPAQEVDLLGGLGGAPSGSLI